MRKKLISKIAKDHPDILNDYIFDGGMLLTPNPIQGEELKREKKVMRYTIEDEKKIDTPIMYLLFIYYSVDIEYIRVLGDDVHCLNQFVSLLLKRLISGLKTSDGKKKYRNDGKNGWFESAKSKVIGDRQKIRLWPGFRVYLSQFGSKFFINMTIKHKVLHESTVLDWIEREGRESVESQLPFTIALTYSNEIHRIDEIDWKQNPTDTFEKKVDGEKKAIQYIDYFKSRYGKEIHNLTQPLLISYKYVGNKSKGKKIGEIKLIPELCVRTGCTDDMRSDMFLSREMIKSTAKKSNEYNDVISDFIKSIPQEEFTKNHMRVERSVLFL